MSEPTRRLHDPILNEDGSQSVYSVLTPTRFTIRGAAYVGSKKVIPVIFIPGTMGTNLRVRRDVPLPRSYPLNPGEPAWRPPNDDVSAYLYARTWKDRPPRERQLILSPDYVEVDDTGELDIASCHLTPGVMRERGWGEIHNGTYGTLLHDLQSHLERTFRLDGLNRRQVRQRWKDVMLAMQGDTLARWGVRSVAPLTEAELETYAGYQYPIYACGYHWLQSCGASATRLEQRITDIIAWWTARKHACSKVILVTHSMGGLVARACARRIPDQIAGVIHGVMPALGAPLVYRRMACGTESSNPANDVVDNIKAGLFADIGGRRTEDTTPVFAVAPGALELLPNQLYPGPWLHIRVRRNAGPAGPRETASDYLHLPNQAEPNPYELYRDMTSWYRLINPALADPASLYPENLGGVEKRIQNAISTAEKFHDGLADYYHPATFAYYCDSPDFPAYGQMRWTTTAASASGSFPMTAANMRDARYLLHEPDGARTVEVEGKFILSFALEPQESRGDDAVPWQSASGPAGKIRQLFVTRGHRHQDSYKNPDTLLLIRYCIVKLVQEVAHDAQDNMG